MAYRLDISALKAPKVRADGTMIAEAHLTRSGVFSYRQADGSERREYRPPAEVFKADSLETFALVPVTDDHPPVMLTARNAKQYSVGSVGESVRQDGDHVAAKIVIHDADVIAKMKSGKQDVSCGYECDIIEQPGTAPDGTRYDAVQTNIKGNHLAIVSKGRADTARVRMDGVEVPFARYDNDLDAAERDKIPHKEFATGAKLPIENAAHVRDAMSRFGDTKFEDAAEKRSAFHKIVAKAHELGIDASGFVKEWSGRLDAVDRKDSIVMNLEQALAALAKAQQDLGATVARADSAEKERDSLKKSIDTITGERDAAVKRADAAEKARKDAVDGAPTRVKERVELERGATAVLGPKFKRLDGVEIEVATAADRDIKLALIQHVDGDNVDTDVAGAKRSDEYVAARYDGAIKRAATATQTLQQTAAFIASNRADAAANGVDLGEAAKAENKKRAANLFIPVGGHQVAAK